MRTYRVAHRKIDGSIIDRERAWRPIDVEMHPIGTELPREKQGRELHLRIGPSHTVLDKRGIDELKEFLEEVP